MSVVGKVSSVFSNHINIVLRNCLDELLLYNFWHWMAIFKEVTFRYNGIFSFIKRAIFQYDNVIQLLNFPLRCGWPMSWIQESTNQPLHHAVYFRLEPNLSTDPATSKKYYLLQKGSKVTQKYSSWFFYQV